jgi:hypothetical protein
MLDSAVFRRMQAQKRQDRTTGIVSILLQFLKGVTYSLGTSTVDPARSGLALRRPLILRMRSVDVP